MKKIIAAILAIIMILSVVLPLTANAAENNDGYGNEWVYDEALVVSSETEDYIKHLNESIFANYANKPQLAFIVIDNLPYNMDDYKLDMFNEYGVGTKEENHGMLFVFAINDREYALEIGDGFTKGSILRKELETDFITEDMKNSLRAENYDFVVYQVAQHLAGMMEDEENLVYAQKEEALAMQKAAEEAAAEERRAKAEAAAPYIIMGGLGILALMAVGYVASLFIKARKREKLFEKLEKQYAVQFALFGEKEADTHTEMKRILLEKEYCCYDEECIEDDFTKTLYTLYLKWFNHLMQENYSFNRLRLYKDAFAARNNFSMFIDGNVQTLEQIVHSVDKEEDQKIANEQENRKRIDEFWENNKHRVENKAIEDCLRVYMYSRITPNNILSMAHLEKVFAQKLREYSFEYECDRFCAENADLIRNRDFDKRAFYTELAHTSNGKNYHYSSTYNNMWMRHYLIAHMSSQRKARELREQKAAEERRRAQQRAAAARRQQQRSYNSSFGTTFRGGFSSGGGFKGGW